MHIFNVFSLHGCEIVKKRKIARRAGESIKIEVEGVRKHANFNEKWYRKGDAKMKRKIIAKLYKNDFKMKLKLVQKRIKKSLKI